MPSLIMKLETDCQLQFKNCRCGNRVLHSKRPHRYSHEAPCWWHDSRKLFLRPMVWDPKAAQMNAQRDAQINLDFLELTPLEDSAPKLKLKPISLPQNSLCRPINLGTYFRWYLGLKSFKWIEILRLHLQCHYWLCRLGKHKLILARPTFSALIATASLPLFSSRTFFSSTVTSIWLTSKYHWRNRHSGVSPLFIQSESGD